MDRFKGQVVVVTGGASGIGEATVRQVISEGGSAVIADLQRERGEALALALGDHARYQHCDVTSEDDVASTMAAAVAHFGTLTGLVNSAGVIGAVGSITETSVEAFDRTLAIHCRGTFLCMKHAARIMKPLGRGAIVSLASTAGVVGGQGPHTYTLAKHGIIGLTRSVGSELVASGIRVNAVAPGGTVTPMTAALADGSTEAMAAAIQAASPLGIACQPEDIANAICYLLSDEARYVSGHTLVVDAGLTTGAEAPPFHSAAPEVLLQAGERVPG